MYTLTDRQKQELLDSLGAVKRFCLSLTNAQADADDLLQLTVERVLEKGLPGDADVLKWSYRVCRNLWLDELRSREVRSRYAQGELAANGDVHVQAADGEQNIELERAGQAMAELPEEQRSALLLVAVEGRSYAEVAEILDIPLGTVMSRVARARRNMVKKLA